MSILWSAHYNCCCSINLWLVWIVDWASITDLNFDRQIRMRTWIAKFIWWWYELIKQINEIGIWICWWNHHHEIYSIFINIRDASTPTHSSPLHSTLVHHETNSSLSSPSSLSGYTDEDFFWHPHDVARHPQRPTERHGNPRCSRRGVQQNGWIIKKYYQNIIRHMSTPPSSEISRIKIEVPKFSQPKFSPRFESQC